MNTTIQTWEKIKQDPSLLSIFDTREKVLDAIRSFFKTRSFREVETPLLVKSPGTEPYLEVFKTQLHWGEQTNTDAFLTTSPELQMKQLLAAGFGNIFQITKSFRNAEGASQMHNPEFTILEWYRTNADYLDVMRDCEELLLYILSKTNPESKNTLIYQGKKYDLAPDWERITVAEAFKNYANITEDALHDSKKLFHEAQKKGYQITKSDTWETVFNQIFLNEIEPFLGITAPAILFDYPISQAALSQKKLSDPRYAERFEFYIAGLELGNAFTELLDGEEQESRMIADLELRKSLGKVPYQLDKSFIKALKSGMPKTGGIAVGVDRLVMLFADVPSVKDTLTFPVSDLF
ncbi:MAG: EF-P lysine aminoacylase EpmA [Microgenomates group bacterium]